MAAAAAAARPGGGAGGARAGGGARARALVVLLDGCRPDALLAADAPRLKSLALGGAFSFHVHCGGVPLSGPCWETILTGAPQEQHAVASNDLSLLGADAAGRPTARPLAACLCAATRGPLCQVYRRGRLAGAPPAVLPPTLFHRLAAAGRRGALLTAGPWEGVGRLCGAPPAALTACLEGGALEYRHWPARTLDEERDAAAEMTSGATGLLQPPSGDESACPDVLVVYYHLIDSAGHLLGFGAEVPGYTQAIAQVDMQVGRLLDALDKRTAGPGGAADEDWLVVVTTDHGGTAQARMPRAMRRAFADCGCANKGLPQTGFAGVHGLPELAQHSQTFQLWSHARNLDRGEMLPAPEPHDIVPTLLHHVLGGDCRAVGSGSDGLPGKVRAFLPLVPAWSIGSGGAASADSPDGAGGGGPSAGSGDHGDAAESAPAPKRARAGGGP